MSETFRPKSNFVWAGTSFLLLILFAANSLFILKNPSQRSVELLMCIVLSCFAYLIWIKPKLILGDNEILVVNPWGSETIAYSDVVELETKWALKIVHTGGKTRVWVAPASGKRRWIADTKFGFYGTNMPLSKSNSAESGTMSESLDSLSGQAAYMIRERIKRLH
jgi:hypothetical protein